MYAGLENIADEIGSDNVSDSDLIEIHFAPSKTARGQSNQRKREDQSLKKISKVNSKKISREKGKEILKQLTRSVPNGSLNLASNNLAKLMEAHLKNYNGCFQKLNIFIETPINCHESFVIVKVK